MHNLNLIKGKHQTNLKEGPSMKRLAWNLLAISSQAGEGGERALGTGEKDPEVQAELLQCLRQREAGRFQEMRTPHERNAP